MSPLRGEDIGIEGHGDLQREKRKGQRTRQGQKAIGTETGRE